MNKLFKILLLTIGLSGIILSLSAQSSGEKTVLWKISENGLTEPSYLFGTMHIIPKNDFVKYKQADKILKSCDQLVLEMLIDVPLKQKIEWSKQMLLPGGKLISDFTDEIKFSQIKSYSIDSLGVSDFFFNTYIKMKPFAFYSALIPHAIGKKIEGYELHYSKIAKHKSIPVHGLESFEYQMAIFDSIPYSRQMEMFFSEDMNLEKDMEEMLSLYMSHDIYTMAALLNEEDSEYAEFEEELLISRNKNWVREFDNLLKEKSCFIAVGAAHLAGNNGLIKLLREEGYYVEAICLSQDCK